MNSQQNDKFLNQAGNPLDKNTILMLTNMINTLSKDQDRFSISNEINFQENENNKEKLDWKRRNNRGGIRPYIIREDEDLFKEHLDNIRKKKKFDFEKTVSSFKISFQNKEVTQPSDINCFSQVQNLDYHILENLKKMEFDIMTPIQKVTFPIIQSGFDVMGCSRTGSGKTLAFLLPIINDMMKNGPPLEDYNQTSYASPITLVLIPTRELADQIYREARKIAHFTGINVVKVYGGVSQDYQLRDLKNGCDVLIATPGRLLDFLKQNVLRLNLVKYFIIDEADRMLDMGFEPQLNSIIFEKDLPDKSKRQNLMFSATFDDKVKNIARRFMNEFYYVQTNVENQDSNKITQRLIFSEENEKVLKLHNILQTISGSVIIFMTTKRGVDNLCSFLLRSNYKVISIHGDKKQSQRIEAINKFSTGEIPILLATDVASRGLDFPKVSYVFNYDLPTNIEDYVHRIGRTGRCGDSGIAISFINENNKPIIKNLYKLLIKEAQEIPDWFEKMFRSVEHQNFQDDNKFLNKKRTFDNYSLPPRYNTFASNNLGYNNSSNQPYVFSSNNYNLSNSFTTKEYQDKSNIRDNQLPYDKYKDDNRFSEDNKRKDERYRDHRDKFRDQYDHKYKDIKDDRYKDKKDEKYMGIKEDRYKETNRDERPDTFKDERFTNNKDERYRDYRSKDERYNKYEISKERKFDDNNRYDRRRDYDSKYSNEHRDRNKDKSYDNRDYDKERKRERSNETNTKEYYRENYSHRYSNDDYKYRKDNSDRDMRKETKRDDRRDSRERNNSYKLSDSHYRKDDRESDNKISKTSWRNDYFSTNYPETISFKKN